MVKFFNGVKIFWPSYPFLIRCYMYIKFIISQITMWLKIITKKRKRKKEKKKSPPSTLVFPNSDALSPAPPQPRCPTSSLPGAADGLLKGHQNRGSHGSSKEARVARSPRWAQRRGTNLQPRSRPRAKGVQIQHCGLAARWSPRWARRWGDPALGLRLAPLAGSTLPTAATDHAIASVCHRPQTTNS